MRLTALFSAFLSLIWHGVSASLCRQRRLMRCIESSSRFAAFREPNAPAIRNTAADDQIPLRSIAGESLPRAISYLAAERFSDIYIVWYLGLIWTLLLLTEIDNRMMLLPDILTVPLLIAGFAYSVFVSQWVIPAESVLGAVTGYMLPVVASAFLVWKNKDAFGGGDIKLLAALGAWLGMELVIYTMILASVLFVLYALARRMRVGAFGPAITIAAIMIAFYFF